MINVYEQQDANKRKSFLVIVVFAIFIFVSSWLITRGLGYGPGALGLALVISGLSSFFGYWYGDKLVLTISKAQPANKKQNYLFYTVSENLAMALQIPLPKLYLTNDPSPNAFAVGRDIKHASVCVTTGLLSILNRTELEGVIAHELSHIKNYDTRLMSVVTVLVGFVTILADWLTRSLFWGNRDSDNENRNNNGIFIILGILMAIISPIIGRLIQLAISRRREFLADSSAVLLTRFPEGLIRALTKISAVNIPLKTATKATENLYIVNPFKIKVANLFNTHPPIEERIKALQAMQ